jgi:hypothetical protein
MPNKKKKPTKRKIKRVDWKKKADNMWSLCIRLHHKQCEICGKRGRMTKSGQQIGGLNAHHIIGRANLLWRHDLRNGLCLCTRCHMWSPDCSPHARSIIGVTAFVDWMKDSKPKQWKWYDDHKLEHRTPKYTYEETFNYLQRMLNFKELPSYDE